MPGPIADLASTLMERELAKNPDQFKVERHVDRSEPGMSPHLLATLGGLVDAGGTYVALKSGNAREVNPLVNMIAGQNPEMTGLTALGGLAATKLGTHLIGKKWPKLAEILAANIGAQQLGLGIHNLTQDKDRGGVSSFKQYNDVLGRNRQKESLSNMVK